MMLRRTNLTCDCAQFFHLPEKAVAKELGICLTSLKKLCRSYGITRWPFRKLKSISRMLKVVRPPPPPAQPHLAPWRWPPPVA